MIGNDLARERTRLRRRWLVQLLGLALDEPTMPKNWEGVIRRACQYGAGGRPKVTAAEFRKLGDMKIRELFEP